MTDGVPQSSSEAIARRDGASELESRVSDGIRAAILAGDYAPGQRLIESDLCEHFGASRFTVRVVLQRLASDGLVEMQHNKGARVRAIPIEETLEILEVRMALEGISAARAAERATAAEHRELERIVADMRRAIQRTDLVANAELAYRLHRTIQRISANDTCTKALGRLSDQLVRRQFALSLQPGRPVAELASHERIVAAIVAGDSASAEAAMRRHLKDTIEAMRAMTSERAR